MSEEKVKASNPFLRIGKDGASGPISKPDDTCHCKFFYRACDAASSIRAATSFGLET
jgi:hypothetical protein